MRHEDSSYKKKELPIRSKYGSKNSRKGIDSKKFAYNFQPGQISINPVFLPITKTPGKLGNAGIQQLPKPKALIPGPAIYKY